jgi:hypothetical protein
VGRGSVRRWATSAERAWRRCWSVRLFQEHALAVVDLGRAEDEKGAAQRTYGRGRRLPSYSWSLPCHARRHGDVDARCFRREIEQEDVVWESA